MDGQPSRIAAEGGLPPPECPMVADAGRPVRIAVVAIIIICMVGMIGSLRLLAHRVPRPSHPAEALGAVLAPPAGRPVLIVDSLRADGPAQVAGLRVGDVVESIGGAPIRSIADADRAIAREAPVDFRVRRGKDEVEVRVPTGREGSID